MEEQKLFGKLFNSIPLLNEDHLDVLLQTMDRDNSIYVLIQAVKHAHESGVYSLGETEVISKCIRTLSKIEEPIQDEQN
jgi:hypothetical protein